MGRDLFSNFIKGNSSYFNVGNIVEVIDSDTKKARKAEVRFIVEDRVTVVYQRDRRKEVVCIDQIRHIRPPRGQEILVKDTITIDSYQLKTMHGCNASKMKEISNFALAEIDLDSLFSHMVLLRLDINIQIKHALRRHIIIFSLLCIS